MNSHLENVSVEEVEKLDPFNDDVFGWPQASGWTGHAMRVADVKPELAVSILTEVSAEWPDVYARGGRSAELWSMIKKIVNNRLITLIVFLSILSVVCGDVADVSNAHATKMLVRHKREGLGQWEQDDTIQNVGTWAREAVKAIVQEEQKIVEAVEKTVEKVEAEIKVLILSSGRIIVWSVLVIILAIGIRFTYPAILIFLRVVWKIISTIFGVVAKTTFCMKCCALAPFLAIRNWYVDRKWRQVDEAVQIEDAIPLQPSTTRNTSEVFFDEFGPHVKGTFGDKIYFSRQQLDVSTYMALGQNPSSERFKEERIKETMLARSVPHTTKSLPDFQAFFTLEGNVIGHCSRIQFKGQTCLLTAYHVLSYNIKADLFLNANGKSVRFSDIRVRILAYSKEDNLDYIVLTIPDTICAKLGLKKAKLARGLTHGSPVSIHQIIGGSSCYTVGIAQKSDKPWTISYGASTIEGSSGAPILNVRKEVVGVHVEGGKTANIGTIPELLRNSKESPQNGDINAEDPRSALEQEEDYSDNESLTESEFDRQAKEYEEYRQYMLGTTGREYDREKSRTWAEEMEDIESDYRGRPISDFHWEVYFYATPSGETGKHIGQRIKRGKIRKESPWTCSRCLTLHMKAGYNCVKCGHGLRPAVKEAFDEKAKVVKECVTPVIADKIIQHLDELSRKYQRLEGIIIAIQDNTGHSLCYEKEPQKFLDGMPKGVSMESRLAHQMQTSPPASAIMGHNTIAIKTSPTTGDVVAKVYGDCDWDVKPPVVASAPLEIDIVKKKKRVRRPKKETATQPIQANETPAVHLNSKSPPKGGATTTSGSTKKPSQPKVKLSADPNAVSTQPNVPQKAISGKKPLA